MREKRTRFVGWRQRETFSGRSLYSSLKVGTLESFLVGIVWNVWVSPKVCFFAWKVTWEKALTLIQLHQRGWSLADRYFLGTLTRSQLTTYFYIVARQGCCDNFCYLILVFHRWFTHFSERLYQVGMPLLSRESGKRFRELLLCAFFG